MPRLSVVRRDGDIFAPALDDPLYVAMMLLILLSGQKTLPGCWKLSAMRPRKPGMLSLSAAAISGLMWRGELEKVSGIRARIIEKDKNVAERAAGALKRTVILNGDAMNAEIQEEAGVQNAEVVLSLTNNDNINILSGVLAKKLGAKSAGQPDQ